MFKFSFVLYSRIKVSFSSEQHVMCIQCLDASAFAKGFTGCIVVLYPELFGKGACVPLSVSAEVVLRSTVFAELDTVWGSTIHNHTGKDCGETLLCLRLFLLLLT